MESLLVLLMVDMMAAKLGYLLAALSGCQKVGWMEPRKEHRLVGKKEILSAEKKE